jgi:hypothetical protein
MLADIAGLGDDRRRCGGGGVNGTCTRHSHSSRGKSGRSAACLLVPARHDYQAEPTIEDTKRLNDAPTDHAAAAE